MAKTLRQKITKTYKYSWEDIGFDVEATPHEHHVEYVAFENDESAGKIPYLHGSVKWDGCSNWDFDELRDCMLHGCGRRDLLRFSNLLVRCWDLTKDLLPTWDSSITEHA